MSIVNLRLAPPSINRRGGLWEAMSVDERWVDPLTGCSYSHQQTESHIWHFPNILCINALNILACSSSGLLLLKITVKLFANLMDDLLKFPLKHLWSWTCTGETFKSHKSGGAIFDNLVLHGMPVFPLLHVWSETCARKSL